MRSSDTEANDDPKIIALKPNYSVERKIQVKDDLVKKTSPLIIPFHFRFIYKVNKFIENPEGILNVRLANSEAEYLKQHTSLRSIDSIKFYLSDPNKEVKDSPSYIFMERSLDDSQNQPKIQTYDWTNKLVIETYGAGDTLQGRTFIHLSEIPLLNVQEEVIKQVTINGVRMNVLFSYTPLLSEDVLDEQSEAITRQTHNQGIQEKKGTSRKALGLIENLKQRIKDMENDNLILRTNVNKIKVKEDHIFTNCCRLCIIKSRV